MKWLRCWCLYWLAQAVVADVVNWADYQIHYTTFNSMLIPTEVASQHQIVRANNRIVTNITIRKADRAIAAHITGHNTNLLGQRFSLEFMEIKEATAIYYLASQLIDERDRLHYTIAIQPEGETEVLMLKFMRRYRTP